MQDESFNRLTTVCGAVGSPAMQVGGGLVSVVAAVVVVSATLFGAACSHPVEFACDESRSCLPRYPDRPFCDINGAYAGSGYTGNTCIASPFDAGPSDAMPASGLLSLTFSQGELTPAFSPDTTEYSVALGLATESITATATTLNATIEVNGGVAGSGTPSSPIALALGATQVSVVITPTNGPSKTYQVTVNRGAGVLQQAYVKASNTGPDSFGRSVAIDGDTLVVGAPDEASAGQGVGADQTDNTAAGSGAAYVFVRSGTTWIQQAYLKASDAIGNDQFGESVSISSDTVVVGACARQSAYVFHRNGTNWSQQAIVKTINTDGADRFGCRVAVSGDTLAISASSENSAAVGINGDEGDNTAQNAGAVYIFLRTGTEWTQQAYLKASNTDAGDLFGFDIALSGNTLAVGAPWEASASAGVGAAQEDNSAEKAGAVYVFTRDSTLWSQQAYLKASNAGLGDHFGEAVDIDANTLVVGAYQENSGATGADGGGAEQNDNSKSNSGAVYVFTRTGTNWTQQAYIKASNTGANDGFGEEVAVSGDTLVVTAVNEASSAMGVGGDQFDNSRQEAGAAYLFVRRDAAWLQQAYVKASNSEARDLFGYAVGISGTTFVIGALREASAALGINGDETDNSGWAGAAYVFE